MFEDAVAVWELVSCGMLFSLRMLLLRSEGRVGVGPADALAVRLRVMLCPDEAGSAVDAGLFLLTTLRPCTVGSQPFLPFLMVAAPSLDRSNAGSRGDGDGNGGTVSGVAVQGDERERVRGFGEACSDPRE